MLSDKLLKPVTTIAKKKKKNVASGKNISFSCWHFT